RRSAWDRLRGEVVEVLVQGIRNGGTAFRDYRGAQDETGRNQHTLAVYGRGGQPCRVCGAALEAFVLGGRSGVYCPEHQRRPRGRSVPRLDAGGARERACAAPTAWLVLRREAQQRRQKKTLVKRTREVDGRGSLFAAVRGVVGRPGETTQPWKTAVSVTGFPTEGVDPLDCSRRASPELRMGSGNHGLFR